MEVQFLARLLETLDPARVGLGMVPAALDRITQVVLPPAFRALL
jgi:hypothetical protein